MKSILTKIKNIFVHKRQEGQLVSLGLNYCFSRDRLNICLDIPLFLYPKMTYYDFSYGWYVFGRRYLRGRIYLRIHRSRKEICLGVESYAKPLGKQEYDHPK